MTGFLTDKSARKWVWLLQLVFILVARPHLDGPFLSVHFERQNQTFDVARHIFHEGWRAILLPKAGFSLPGWTDRPFTIVRFEVPFHGILGWPIALLTGHERLAVRLVSVTSSLISIRLVFLILRRWLKPEVALFGTFLWATAPLVLQFGQVPMPDILATTGLLASFYFALRSKTCESSVYFLFAILGKESVLPFGLPVLVALLEAKDCRSLKQILSVSILWIVAPLLGICAWLSIDLFGPATPWRLFGPAIADRGGFRELINPLLYAKTLGCIFPYGIGIFGMVGLGIGIRRTRAAALPIPAWAILIASAFYFVFVVRKIDEPQYFLPLLVWCVMGASFGLARLVEFPFAARRRALILILLAVHLLVTFSMANDLKRSRVPNFQAIEETAKLIPENERVLVSYRHYGAGPSVWLNRNVLAIPPDRDPAETIQAVKAKGFAKLLILDIESRYSGRDQSLNSIAASAFNALAGHEAKDSVDADVGQSSEVQRYAEKNYKLLFQRRHVLLYSLGDL